MMNLWMLQEFLNSMGGGNMNCSVTDTAKTWSLDPEESVFPPFTIKEEKVLLV